MTIKKDLPMDIKLMIDREEIRSITGCTHNEMVYITKYRPNKFPAWVDRGANRKLWYKRDTMLLWLSGNNIHELFCKRTIIAEVKAGRETFSNSLAVKFLSSPWGNQCATS